MKVVNLAPPSGPDPDVVRACEELLASAKSGDLTALVAVAEYRDGEVEHVIMGAMNDYTMAGHCMAIATDMVLDG